MEGSCADERAAGAYLDAVLDRVCGRGFSAVIEHQFSEVLGAGLYATLLRDPLAAEGVLAMMLGGQNAVDLLFDAVEGALRDAPQAGRAVALTLARARSSAPIGGNPPAEDRPCEAAAGIEVDIYVDRPKGREPARSRRPPPAMG